MKATQATPLEPRAWEKGAGGRVRLLLLTGHLLQKPIFSRPEDSTEYRETGQVRRQGIRSKDDKTSEKELEMETSDLPDRVQTKGHENLTEE